MESRDLVSVSRLVSTPIFCESWSRSFQVSRLWILQRNGLLKFLWFIEFLFIVLAGKKQPKHVGKMPEIWNKLMSEVMTTFSKIISAKCTNFDVSVSNFKSRVLVSEFLMNSRSQRLRCRLYHCGNKHGESVLTSDGLARLGLGLETCLKAGFLESRSRRSQVSSRSRALRLETLHRLFFMNFCKKEFLKTTVSKIIVPNSAVQRGRWLCFLCCYVVCDMEKTICPLPRLKFMLNSIKNVHVPKIPQHVISATRVESILLC